VTQRYRLLVEEEIDTIAYALRAQLTIYWSIPPSDQKRNQISAEIGDHHRSFIGSSQLISL